MINRISKRRANQAQPSASKLLILDFRRPLFERVTKFIREFGSLLFLASGSLAISKASGSTALGVFSVICLGVMWMLTHDFTASLAQLKTFIKNQRQPYRSLLSFGLLALIIAVNGFIFMAATEAVSIAASTKLPG